MPDLDAKQLSQVLLRHASRYPLMEPADAVKLVYQSVFGGGHLIADPEASLLRLTSERAATSARTDAPFVEIGNKRVRMHLAVSALSVLPDTLLNRMFVLSAAEPAGDASQFREALNLLFSLVKTGVFRFGEDAFSDYLRPYIASGCPMVSHSETYRRAYRPAYRVVDARYAQILPVIVSVQIAVASGAPETRVSLESPSGISPQQIFSILRALFERADLAPAGAPFVIVRT